MPSFRPLPRALAACALAALSVLGPVACGDKSPTAPTTTTPSTTNKLTVAQYMDSALTLMQNFSIKESTNWAAFRSTYRAAAASATTYAQTYPIIQQALTALDPHSSISTPDKLPGSTDQPANQPFYQVQSKMISRVGYVWVPGFVGTNQNGRVDTTHAALRALDANDPCGWIVDLRANNGGFFYALMASLGPLYATNSDPFVGGQQFAGNYQQLWYYRQRGTRDVFGIRDTRDSAEFTVNNPFRPKRPGLPVAVLHSTSYNSAGQLTTITASSGESLTLAFRGGPPTRSFGMPTYGVASGRDYFFMPDSARIDITSSFMMDRRGYKPGDSPIPPDETIASLTPISSNVGNAADPVIAAAATWLQNQSACTGAGVLANRVPAEPRITLVPTAPPANGAPRLPNSRTVYERPVSASPR